MTRILVRLASVLLLAAVGTPLLAADRVTEDVPLPGGTRALAHVLGIDPAPERARAVAEFARLLHGLPQGVNPENDARLARLRSHSTAVDEFQAALAATQPAGGGISLSMASASKTDRKRLQDFLELVGLRLREQKKQYSVEQRKDKDAAARLLTLADVGVDLTLLEKRLNARETVRIDVPADEVPIPLGTAFWSATVFRQPIAPRDIVTAILADRKAALLCLGLASLDDETLGYLAAHPQIAADLYESKAPAFGAFASGLRIHDARVVPPGDSVAVALWENVAGESVRRPDRFIREIFGRDSGRFAYFYDTVAHLSPDRRAFALGVWIIDAGLRGQRFKALAQASASSVSEWDIERRPFVRTPYDVAMVLSAVRVQPGGGPSEPAAQKLWSRAFESDDLPDEPMRQLRNVDEDGAVDAAWLVEQIATVDALKRPGRFEQFRFGQRVFGGAAKQPLGDVLVALRALPRFPVLMQALDRAGVRSPAAYAAAARRAALLARLDSLDAFIAEAQFQGGLALVAQLAAAGTTTREQTESLVTALATLAPDADGRLAGGMASWLEASVGAAVNAPGAVTERILIDAAAGVGRGDTPTIQWEERQYSVDVPDADARHFRRVRASQQGATIDAALALDRIRRQMASASVALTDVRSASDTLAKMAPRLARVTLTPVERPPGLDELPNVQDLVTRVSKDLAKITRPKDLKKAADSSERLAASIDVALAESLLSLSYVWALGSTDMPASDGGHVALRHNFGFDAAGDAARKTMWEEPRADLAPGHPWRLKGGLLGLDVAFGPQSLRRLTSDSVPVATIGGDDVVTFTRSFALLNPRLMRDADQAALSAAIARGRARVLALRERPSELDMVAREIDLDGWRHRAVQWALDHEPEQLASFFAVEDLIMLGHVEEQVNLAAWGMADGAGGGCLCSSLDGRTSWATVTGRGQLGQLPTEVPDLHLRVAVALQELGLPAILGKGVLAAVVQVYLDRVRPSDGDDWLTLVRTAQAISREEIEDAVASLTSDGPLVPLPAQGQSRNP